MERPSKRMRVERGVAASGTASLLQPASLTRPISPVAITRRRLESPATPAAAPKPKTFNSPFQLTTIRDLPPSSNEDTVSLKDLLGDPLISECWEFNYLHDIDFLMNAFDEDVRGLVKVHVVHGFWKQEDRRRHALQLRAAAYSNVTLHAAFLPEMFGTHHTKMVILLRHDGTSQVIIHTANMIPRDWGNMTQAVWRSPLLSLLRDGEGESDKQPSPGSGHKFKLDLLNYLRAYDRRRVICRPLIDCLARYDFSPVKAALIASVPGRHNIRDDSPTRWGWASLKQALLGVPVQDGKSDIVVQVSSIATLGPTENWLRNTLFAALGTHKGRGVQKPDFKVVFPTPDEIRRSLDGYESGASIHTKIQSAQQARQLEYLRPILRHWANDSEDGPGLPPDARILDGGRKRAAPHVKTYVRYGCQSIDWALVTSANLSKQAWGEAENSFGEIRISSYELGVLVWPSLYAEKARLVPTFRTDTAPTDCAQDMAVVGLRIPYNLPLQPYGKREVPWVATADHEEPDWKGRVWKDN